MNRTAPDLPLPTEVLSLLRAIRRRRALALSLRLLTTWALLVPAWLAVVGGLDRALALGGMTRAALLATLLGVMLVGLIRLLRQLISERRVLGVTARSLGPSRPVLCEKLLTLLKPAEPGCSISMLRSMSRSAARDCSSIRAADLLPASVLLQPLRRWIAPALLLVALTFVPGVDAASALRRLLFPLRADAPDLAWSMEVSPGDVALPPGTSLRIEVRGRGTAPAGSKPLLHWESAGLRRVEPMRPSGTGFSFVFAAPTDDVRFEVAWSGLRSPTHVARVLRPPAARSIEARLLSADGSRDLPTRLDLSGGRLSAPVGSRLQLVVESTEPLSRATMEAGGSVAGTVSEDGMQATFNLSIERDLGWRILLVGRNGLESDKRLKLEVTALPDEPPTVRAPDVILRAAPGSSVRVPFFAADDHGIVALQRLISSRGAVEGRELPLLPTARAPRGLFDSGPLSAPAGEVICLHFEARDTRGQTARSERVGVLVGDGNIGAFDPLRPLLLSDAARRFAEATRSLRDLDDAVRQGRPESPLRDAAAEHLRQAIEQVVAAATDADDATRDALAALADAAAVERRALLELPLEPARRDEIVGLRASVARCREAASARSRWLLARLLLEDLRSEQSFRESGRDAEARRLLDAAARQRRRWAETLGLRPDDAGLLDKLRTEAPADASPPGIPELLERWRAGASADAIADRLLLGARFASLAPEPDADAVADAVTLSRAVRSAGHATSEERDAARDRVLMDWDAVLEARSVGAFFAEERARRRLRAAGNPEPLGRALQTIAEEASAASAPLLDLSDRCRALEAVRPQLSPEDWLALRRRLEDDARPFASDIGPDEPIDNPATWDRAARRRSAKQLRSALWRSAETAIQFRLIFSGEPRRTDAPPTLPQRWLRLLAGSAAPTGTPTTPTISAGYDDALRAYFRLLNRGDERTDR